MTPIAPLVETFLRDTLACQRGASRHKRDSYALSFQLLFVFAADRLKVKPSALTLEQIDAGLVSAFLEHLEDERKNAAVTRNVSPGGDQVVLPLPRVSAAGGARADPPCTGDPVQEN
ncbi:hypothetical protein [Bradyrhizobium ivorense]|uniref:hypothetical protein n=1 Tax=Bradyrhizobium ivorense TaxID=2511166 RepID=UPI001E437D1D|nr:hypothetical protein [Bradyrhizobium ivorense]